MSKERLMSYNPEFTELLRDWPMQPDGFLIGKWGLYTSADDGLPPHEHLKAARLRLQEDAVVVVEATDLLAPGDENVTPERWPHPMAKPTLAITGSIPIYKL